MIKRLGMLIFMLVVVGALGITLPAQEGSETGDGSESSGSIAQCYQEWMTIRYPWELVDETYRCNRTHRCWFFITKGCYHVWIYERLVERWRRTCC